jgi:Dyp-type peroxidase family
MKRGLDLADIQGNIVRPYGRFGFPLTRHFFFHIGNPAAGRNFIEQVRHRVTTAERWGAIDGDTKGQAPVRPNVAINIGLSYQGLSALALPTRTLSALPEEFIDGMAKRWSILGDLGVSAPSRWDPIWCDAQNSPEKQVHIWISFSAQIEPDGRPVKEFAELTDWLREAAAGAGGVTLLSGHRGPSADYQDSSALMAKLPDGQVIPTAKVHFGFTDGIADPVFYGQYEPELEAVEVIGSGKLQPDNKGWTPLAVGEFILGHASEAQELPPTAPPWSFTRNGTFMAYRKMHQNVGTFGNYVDGQASAFQKAGDAQSLDEARNTILAKMVGRWPGGIPIAIAPTWDQSQAIAAQWTDIPAIQLTPGIARTAAQTARLAAYDRLLTDFRYQDDIDGARCPVSAHIRRTNPRDALDPYFGVAGENPGSALTNRRRILRRGLPYGDSTVPDDTSEHGVIFMALCASLFRQFEFIQQQWVNYGSSFAAGNDTDPVVGLHREGAKFVIAADPGKDGAPFICANIPQFVETRGGEYFFIPSLTALREIAQGSVDPT